MDNINEILEQHKLWLETNGKQGKQAILQNLNLKYHNLKNIDLSYAYLAGVNLSGATLSNINFKGAILHDVDMENASLTDSNLQNVYINKSFFKNVHFKNVNFSGAKVDYTNFSFSTFINPFFKKCIINSGKFKFCKIHNTILEDVQFCDSDLSESTFSDVDFSNANLTNANLSYSDLSDSYLNTVDLSEVNLTKVLLPKSTFIILSEHYFITIVEESIIRVGKHVLSIDKWYQLSEDQILKMDVELINFYPRLIDILDFYCSKKEQL